MLLHEKEILYVSNIGKGRRKTLKIDVVTTFCMTTIPQFNPLFHLRLPCWQAEVQRSLGLPER
jgi:hypothetical protein